MRCEEGYAAIFWSGESFSMYYDVSLGHFIRTVALSAMVLIWVWVFGAKKKKFVTEADDFSRISPRGKLIPDSHGKLGWMEFVLIWKEFSFCVVTYEQIDIH